MTARIFLRPNKKLAIFLNSTTFLQRYTTERTYKTENRKKKKKKKKELRRKVANNTKIEPVMIKIPVLLFIRLYFAFEETQRTLEIFFMRTVFLFPNDNYEEVI